MKVIEHGQLADEETAKMMPEKGIWWSLQPPSVMRTYLPEWTHHRKNELCRYSLQRRMPTSWQRSNNVKTVFGADILGDAGAASRQGAYLVHIANWNTPAETLKMATANNGKLMALSGFINPYPGKLGVVEEGALADLLVVDGNPIENIKLIEHPAKNFLVIMKDGKIYKNTLTPRSLGYLSLSAIVVSACHLTGKFWEPISAETPTPSE